MNTISRRAFLGTSAGVGIAGATGLLAGCAGGSSAGGSVVKIINTSATASITMNHLMEHLGYFKTFGVKTQMTNVKSGTEVMAALGSDSADITLLSGFISVFPAIEKGMDVKVLGGTQLVATEGIFTADPAVKSVRDLSGKTLGVGAVGAQLYDGFLAMLTKYHISPKSVTFRNVGSSADSFKAVIAKQVDVGYGQIGNKVLADEKGARMIGTVNGELPLWINQGAVANAKAVEAKRDGLVKVLAAYAKLFQYLRKPESKSTYVDAYVAAEGKADEAEIEWKFINDHTSYSPTLELPVAKANFVQQLNVQAGSQKKVLPFKSYTDLSLRKDALAMVKG